MKHIAKEDDLVGDYKVTAQLKSNNVYQWVKAINRKNKDLVVLQILVLNSKEAVPIISKYFETLLPISKKGLMSFQLLSEHEYPLVVVYSDFSGESLDSAFKRVPERKIEWLKEASEILFALHNRSLVHGCVTPDCFVVVKETVYLMGFGYAPLLQLGHQDALGECRDFLAPEVLDQHSVTSATDVYAFAKTVVHWLPELETTQWYEKAIEQDPGDRFQNMRKLLDELKKAFDTLSGSDAHTDQEEERDIDETPEEFKGGQVPSEPEEGNKGGLIPKYILTVKVEPFDGGTVKGEGSYLPNKKVKVRAIPTSGWQFQSWSGNLNTTNDSEILEMDGNKEITALFVRKYILTVKLEPLDGGTVKGEGSYLAGEKVKVRAIPTSGWHFQSWSGNLNTTNDYETLAMDGDKEITALFVRIPPTPKKKIHPAALFFSLILVFAGLLGGLYLYEIWRKKAEVQQLFETAKEPAQTAIKQAESAIKQAESAKKIEELEAVRDLWEETLKPLKPLEPASSNLRLSPQQQEILANYKSQQSAVEDRINQELLFDAEKIAGEAGQKTEIAETVDDFIAAKSLWEDNLKLLQKITSKSFDSQNVEELKAEAKGHIQDLKVQVLFETAKIPAQTAMNQAESAQNIEDLNAVKKLWKETLDKLEPATSNLRLSPQQQEILANYKSQQSAVEARIKEERNNQKLLVEAEAIAKDANQKTEIAKTVDELTVAKSLWEKNLEQLQKITSNSFENQKVEELKAESDKHIKDLQRWINRGCKTGYTDTCLE